MITIPHRWLALLAFATATTALAQTPTHLYTAPQAPTASYAPPASNAVYVAENGDDANAGTLAAPLRSVRKAIAIVNAKPAGPRWTIVLRGGVYREGQALEGTNPGPYWITRSDVTVQRYRNEVPILRGSLALGGFAGSGPYTKTIAAPEVPDPAALEQNCAQDILNAGDSRHFGAEQAFSLTRNGVPLRRVDAPPAPGEYRYDVATRVLTLADAPENIELAYRGYALWARGANIHFLGLGVEGYATCALDFQKSVTANGRTYLYTVAAVMANGTGATGFLVENSTLANNAGEALAIKQPTGATMRGNVIVNNGHNGVHVFKSDGFVMTGNRVGWNNFRRFASGHVESGMKMTRSKDGVIHGNVFEHNVGSGFWCDQGCGATAANPLGHFVIAGNLSRYNDKNGLYYEVSSRGMLVSNWAYGNAGSGISAHSAHATQLWNNTLVDNAVGYPMRGNLTLYDEPRCLQDDVLPCGHTCTVANGYQALAPGNADQCESTTGGAFANTCNSDGTVAMNNIVSSLGIQASLMNVMSPSNAAHHYGALRMMTGGSDYQAFWRAGNAPSVLTWQGDHDANPNPNSYATLELFRAANPGFEVNSVLRTTGSVPPYFMDYAARDLRQNPASTDVWGRGAPIPVEALRAAYWPDPAPVAPQPLRIGALYVPGIDRIFVDGFE